MFLDRRWGTSSSSELLDSLSSFTVWRVLRPLRVRVIDLSSLLPELLELAELEEGVGELGLREVSVRLELLRTSLESLVSSLAARARRSLYLFF